jgi:hypothetical protein
VDIFLDAVDLALETPDCLADLVQLSRHTLTPGCVASGRARECGLGFLV